MKFRFYDGKKLTRKVFLAEYSERTSCTVNYHTRTDYGSLRGQLRYYDMYEGFVRRTVVKPLFSIPDYESNPQVWLVLTDMDGVWFTIYSDAKRKNCYKGTSVEIGGIMGMTDDEIRGYVIEFYNWIDLQQ